MCSIFFQTATKLLEKIVTRFFDPNYLIPDVFGKAFGLGAP